MYLNDGRKEVNGQPAGKKNSLFWYLYESLFEYSFFIACRRVIMHSYSLVGSNAQHKSRLAKLQDNLHYCPVISQTFLVCYDRVWKALFLSRVHFSHKFPAPSLYQLQQCDFGLQ